MKAKYIKESISFERGGDPKAVLGIGYNHLYHVDEIMNALQEIKKNSYLGDFLPYDVEILVKNEERFSAGILGKGKNDLYGIQYSPDEGFEAWYENQRHPDNDSEDCEDINECISVLEGWMEYGKEQSYESEENDEDEEGQCIECGEELSEEDIEEGDDLCAECRELEEENESI
jgi:hypothetical protein